MDDADIETLVTAAARGDDVSWQRLWVAIEPSLSRLIAQPRFLGRLGRREDDRKNIVLLVIERLRADNSRRLQLYLEARADNPRLQFLTWLRVVAKRVGIDYLRAHQDYIHRDDSSSRPGKWVDPGTLPPGSQLFGQRPPVTNNGTAHQLMKYAAEFPDDQRRGVELWMQGERFDDIAKQLGLPHARDAERMVRAAIERLRRKFRDQSEDGTS